MSLLKRLLHATPALQKLAFRWTGPLRHYWWRMRLIKPTAPDPVTPDMVPQPLEGYAHQLFYTPGQTVQFHLKALQPGNELLLQRRTRAETWDLVADHTFHEILQAETLDESQQGCHWSVGWEYTLPDNQPQGYYRALLVNEGLSLSSEIHFLVGPSQATGKVVVLAPVTTWLAYNAYGGQSLYRNAVAAEPVTFVSTLRPNTALTYIRSNSHQHDLRIESHIYNWFAQHYQADLLPDYLLEAHPEKLTSYKVLVLAYHCEYFSEAMYQALQKLVWQQGKSLLSIGGNQVYWQVRWHQNFTQVECPKNGSFFQKSLKRGGLWRHTSTPESTLLGVHFTEAGMGTYALYQVVEPNNWLFENCEVKAGELFGQLGIDGLPICGDETDKTTGSSPENTVVLARGVNKTSATAGSDVYVADDKSWDGAGGGEITYTELSEQNAVLATGSIQSGAGLGVDKVFTQMIDNFMQRYLA
jgi:N,N-dimethylformamidase